MRKFECLDVCDVSRTLGRSQIPSAVDRSGRALHLEIAPLANCYAELNRRRCSRGAASYRAAALQKMADGRLARHLAVARDAIGLGEERGHRSKYFPAGRQSHVATGEGTSRIQTIRAPEETAEADDRGADAFRGSCEYVRCDRAHPAAGGRASRRSLDAFMAWAPSMDLTGVVEKTRVPILVTHPGGDRQIPLE
ncbi:hypothetical protein ABIB95_008294 [Bradyrhizobium sp. LA2.1]